MVGRTTMKDQLASFEQWLMEEGRALKTIESYTSDVKAFQQFLREKSSTESQSLSRFAFVRYKQHLLDQSFAMSTINKQVTSLKVFNDFLKEKGIIHEIYISIKKDRVQIAEGSEHIVTALSEEEVDRLLFFLEDQLKVSQRNKLIVYLLMYTGVRVTELVNIKLSDLDVLTASLLVRGKGGKVREIGLRQDVIQLIKQYQQTERAASIHHESEHLLLSQRSPKMHRDAVRDWLAKISPDVGVKLHPHLFRHTFATRLLRKGVDLTTVSKLIGHSSMNMTVKFYIQTTKKEKKDAVERL
jgi:integrase/recombinase XerD